MPGQRPNSADYAADPAAKTTPTSPCPLARRTPQEAFRCTEVARSRARLPGLNGGAGKATAYHNGKMGPAFKACCVAPPPRLFAGGVSLHFGPRLPCSSIIFRAVPEPLRWFIGPSWVVHEPLDAPRQGRFAWNRTWREHWPTNIAAAPDLGLHRHSRSAVGGGGALRLTSLGIFPFGISKRHP